MFHKNPTKFILWLIMMFIIFSLFLKSPATMSDFWFDIRSEEAKEKTLTSFTFLWEKEDILTKKKSQRNIWKLYICSNWLSLQKLLWKRIFFLILNKIKWKQNWAVFTAQFCFLFSVSSGKETPPILCRTGVWKIVLNAIKIILRSERK